MLNYVVRLPRDPIASMVVAQCPGHGEGDKLTIPFWGFSVAGGGSMENEGVEDKK